jgi:hypothetical protein
LPLAARPRADQAAGVPPWLQPVAEILAGDALEQGHVALEPRNQGLTLLPRQRPPGRRVLLQQLLETIGHPGPYVPRQQRRERRARPPGRGHDGVPESGVRVNGDVLARQAGQAAGLYPEERADPVQCSRRIGNQGTVPEHKDLAGREDGVQVG